MAVTARRVTLSSFFALLLMNPASAFAWGGDVTQAREVYRDNMAIRMSNGSTGRATIVFTISATAYVGQDGNARWPDDRRCYYNDINRTLVRSLTLTTADGTVIPVRDTMIALPSESGYRWGQVNTCNDKINEINGRLSSSIGNAQTWQSYIDGEKSEVLKIISQFGQVI
jgi:hypothetical protein